MSDRLSAVSCAITLVLASGVVFAASSRVGQYSIHAFRGGRSSYSSESDRSAIALLRRVWPTPISDKSWVLYVADWHVNKVVSALACKLIEEPADRSMNHMLQLYVVHTILSHQRRGSMFWLVTAVRCIASQRHYSDSAVQPFVYVTSRPNTVRIWPQAVSSVCT